MDGIKMEFKGVEYSIPAHRAYPVARMVEKIATVFEISAWHTNPRFGDMAACVGVMLRFAGGKMPDEEIWQELQVQFHNADRTLYSSSLLALIELLMGQAPTAKAGTEGAAPGK